MRASGARRTGNHVPLTARSSSLLCCVQVGGATMTRIDLLRDDDGSKKGKKKKAFLKRQQARLDKRLARMDNEDEAQVGVPSAQSWKEGYLMQTSATTTAEKVPRTFVLHYGKRKSRQMARLVNDVRRCMEPYTASKLKVCVLVLFRRKWHDSFTGETQQSSQGFRYNRSTRWRYTYCGLYADRDARLHETHSTTAWTNADI